MNKSKNLTEQLKEFGLNPNYWMLQKLREKHRWMIIHKQDRNLRLMGKAKEKNGWEDLKWLI